MDNSTYRITLAVNRPLKATEAGINSQGALEQKGNVYTRVQGFLLRSMKLFGIVERMSKF